MAAFALTPPAQAHLDITGSDEKFPVRRIYCIGKNYVAHIIEMNADERDPPVIFMKPTDAIVKNGGEIPYPVFTTNFHYECELVVALKSGGYNIPVSEASQPHLRLCRGAGHDAAGPSGRGIGQGVALGSDEGV